MPQLGTALQQNANGITGASANDGMFLSSEYDRDETIVAAAMKGNVETMRLLLRETADNADGVDARVLDEALRWASYKGHADLVQLLLSEGAINAQDAHSDDALQRASHAGHAPVVQMLLDGGDEIGADIITRGRALEFASSAGNAKVVRMLLGTLSPDLLGLPTQNTR
jgi:ankyrin repeat protein